MAKLTATESVVKCLVFVFNLIFALIGLFMVVYGVIILRKWNHYGDFLATSRVSPPVLMIAIGALIFFVSALGCCGAIKAKSCLVLTFAIILTVMVLIEVVIGISIFLRRHQIVFMLNDFDKALSNYKDHEFGWKLLHSELECCGIDGPDDWKKVFHNSKLPASCCPPLPQHETECDLKHAFKYGCKAELKRSLETMTSTLLIVCVVVASLQLLGIFMACCLYRSYRRDYEKV